MEIDYFAESEFRKCVPACDKSQMDKDFMKRLNRARRIAGIPFVLNCAYRSKEWDISKGRTGNSYHTLGRAVDIRCLDSLSRFVMVRALLSAGFHGIGIANTYIHVDDRANQVLYLY